MTAPATDDTVTRLLGLALLLDDTGEPRWAELLRYLSRELVRASGPAQLRSAVGEVMTLFAGMGSFNDLVLQTATGVRPEQAELDRQRTALHLSVQRLVA